MKLIDTKSLAKSVDLINDNFFYGHKLIKTDRIDAAKWIASRQGLEGSYSGMPAPTKSDFDGIRVFTGEKLTSHASIAHILGEESCRALILLNVHSEDVTKSLNCATDIFIKRLRDSNAEGMYCCGICTDSYWRHLAAGGLEKNEQRLKAGLKALKEHRDGKSKWRRFPYYYTLLALDDIHESEFSTKNVIAEMRYAASGLERLLKRKPKSDKYDIRRRALAERILGKC